MKTGKHDIVDRPYLTSDFAGAETRLGELLQATPIPSSELAENCGLFLPPRTMKRILFFDELYRRILPVHGIVIQFGVRWGRDLGVLHSLRTIHEPFNATRVLLGFDTFEGLSGEQPQDGGAAAVKDGVLSVTSDYPATLDEVFEQRRRIDPLPQVRRLEIVAGDAPTRLAEYLATHPETIIALAHFDMDLYEPTKRCLELIRPFLTKGSVLAFDELLSAVYPGETVAYREVFGLDRYPVRRSEAYSGHGSYVVIE